MITAFKIWFGSLSKTGKVATVVVSILLLALAVQSARLARSEYLRLKAIEKEWTEANEKVEEAEKAEEQIVKRNYKNTKKTINKNNSINTKLEQDEKIIDSTSISDDERNRFISEYENKR